MNFTLSILLFWVVVYGILLLALKFPNNRISTVLFSWRGPEPRMNETYSRFNVRIGVFYSNWAMQSLGLFLILWYSVEKWPEIAESQYFLLFLVAIPLLFAVFACAAVLYFLKSFKHRWFGPNPTFIENQHAPD